MTNHVLNLGQSFKIKMLFFTEAIIPCIGWSILLLTSLGSQAQTSTKKDLTLKQAVMGQWREFYPTHVSQLSWRPETDAMTYRSDDNKSMFIQQVGKKQPETLLTAAQLSEQLEGNFRYVPYMWWVSKNELRYDDDGYYVVLRLSEKDTKIEEIARIPLPKKGDNTAVHQKSQQVAYTRAHNLYVQNKQGQEMAVTKGDDPNIVSGQAIARQEFGITKGIFWSPKGRYVAFYQKDETDVADYPLLDINNTPGTLRMIKYPMAGQKSERARVGIYNTQEGKTTYLMVSGDPEQYLTNVGWGPNEQYVYVAIVNRGQNHVWLNQYEAATGRFVKTLFEEKHEKYVEPEHPVWFIPGRDNEFLWWSERDGYMHLHRYNTDGDYLGQVTSGEWVTLNILGLDASKKNILVRGTDALGLNTTVYCTPLEGGKSKRLVKEEGRHNFRLSSSGKYLIDEYSSVEEPYIARVITLKEKVKNELHHAENPYNAYHISQPEIFQLKAKDGTTLNARMIKPADFDPSKKYPVIVYVYGGPHAQMINNSWLGGAQLWMYYAANQGYLVFTLDNRGSSNRGFEFESIIHRQLGKVEMEDQLVGVEHLKSLPYVDANRMAVHGWSFGGYMTTSLMLKHPEVFKVGVAGGPVTDWNYYEVMYGERYMDMPNENPEGYRDTQLKNFVKNLKGDLLLIHGTVDDVVVMQHNLSLVQAFVSKGILVDFFPYPMHPHNVRGKDRVHLMNKVLTYIDEQLKGGNE